MTNPVLEEGIKQLTIRDLLLADLHEPRINSFEGMAFRIAPFLMYERLYLSFILTPCINWGLYFLVPCGTGGTEAWMFQFA